MTYYAKAYNATKTAMSATFDNDAETYVYDGYTGGGNAISAYLNKEHGINVNAVTAAYDGFADAIAGIPNREGVDL
jgi:hypothetical protein